MDVLVFRHDGVNNVPFLEFGVGSEKGTAPAVPVLRHVYTLGDQLYGLFLLYRMRKWPHSISIVETRDFRLL